MGLKECPYMFRWVFHFGEWLPSVHIHKWHRSDDGRNKHDHPWWFIVLVLRGSYIDCSLDKEGLPDKEDLLSTGSIRFRTATHRHYVKVLKDPTWTIIITGPKRRNWGFWIGKDANKFLRPLKYFDKYGHPPCDVS